MKPSSWDKQLGLALPLERAAGQSRQTNNPSKNEVGLDVSHHTRVFPRGGEKLFFLTSSFIGCVHPFFSRQFEQWLARSAGSPREVVLRKKLRSILEARAA